MTKKALYEATKDLGLFDDIGGRTNTGGRYFTAIDGTSSYCRNWVYFIEYSESSPIKIGTAFDCEDRMKALQTAHHEELRIVAKIPGDSMIEKKVHAYLSESRIRGEWFSRSDKLVELVALAKFGAAWIIYELIGYIPRGEY